ncbi:hypothetical protein ACRALDRAFT_206500 [Sodiomyces alcalophilus JCM 7366]|uniref:uncharacterized protein n=1 Tax=Sodiomyces alcalophilus JCM 7366 TaxID=591952 RepID=UPI0039B48DE0
MASYIFLPYLDCSSLLGMFVNGASIASSNHEELEECRTLSRHAGGKFTLTV